MTDPSVIIVGAGVYGVTAALALRRRGWQVRLLDPGPLPHPAAASTDISKVIRLDYGPDEPYMAWMEHAFEGWERWNRRWPERLYHRTGVFYPTRAAWHPGKYEAESFALLRRRGHTPERLDAGAIAARFPAWRAAGFVDGYFNPLGGYAESGRVMAQLIREAQAAGVELLAGRVFARLHEAGSRVGGVITTDGGRLHAGQVLVAAGAWTHHLLPWMSGWLRSTGMPVWHFRPPDPELFRAERFPVFGADITLTGYYGFPLNRDGVVKLAHHGAGRAAHPDAPDKAVTAEETEAARAFLRDYLPGLVAAPVVFTRRCFYSDTWDGHFWIAPDPDRDGLVVAAGCGGHAFKFAPVLGDCIADAVEGRPHPMLSLFRWRPEVGPGHGQEASRQAAEL